MALNSRSRTLPQVNWPVAAPLVAALALIVGISGFVYGLLAPNSDDTSGNAARLQQAAGGGYFARPPEFVKPKLFSLSARVIGTPTVRNGPGTQYDVVLKGDDGQEFHVIACSPGCEWLRILNLEEAGQWWIPASFLAISGKTDELPVQTPGTGR